MEVGPAPLMVELHHALDVAGIPHAFGGALALAWCTGRARGTIDVDLNAFVPTEQADAVVAALPDGVTVRPADRDLLTRDGQARLWWGKTPLDLFLNTTEFHTEAAGRVRREPFLGEMLPFLGCSDLAVFKAFFDRSKDWVDLEEMANAGSLDATSVLGTLTLYLGGDDHRVERLRLLVR